MVDEDQLGLLAVHGNAHDLLHVGLCKREKKSEYRYAPENADQRPKPSAKFVVINFLILAACKRRTYSIPSSPSENTESREGEERARRVTDPKFATKEY